MTRGLLFGCALLCACSARVERDNPLDPDGTGPKKPGRISGEVWIQGALSQAGTTVRLFDEEGSLADSPVTSDEQGSFISAEVSPGIYSLVVEVPIDNEPVSMEDIEVLPGKTEDVGRLSSELVPPDGILLGEVSLDDPATSPANVRIFAVRQSDGQSWTTFTDATGAFRLSALPPGDYEVLAEKQGFTPDRATATLAAPARAVSTLDRGLLLYPASAVVRFSVPQPDGSTSIGARFSRTDSVSLLLLAFGGVNEMRLSTSPDFIEGGVEVEWREHVAEVPWTLTGGAGDHTVYAQFRVVQGSERLRTEAYSASVTLDTAPPSLTSLTVDPEALVVGDVRYVMAPPTAVPLELTAVDDFSSVAGIKLVLGGVDPALVPYEDVTSQSALLYFAEVVALSPAGQGEKTVSVQLQDGAGNESEVWSTTVTVDTLGPARLVPDGSPAIAPVEQVGSYLTSLSPTLRFLVGADAGTGADAPVSMRWGTSPSSLGSWRAFQDQLGVTLSLLDGAPVQFFAEFADAAGNTVTADSAALVVKLTGRVRGAVYLEGLPEDGSVSLAGSSVEIFTVGADLASVPLATPVVGPFGTFESVDLPAGAYKLRVSRGGYSSALEAPVSIAAADVTDIGAVRLSVARGGLSRVFQYGDPEAQASGEHGGIRVEALRAGATVAVTFTDDDGVAAFSLLPVGAYTVRGSAEDYLSASVAVTVEPNSNDVDATPTLLSRLVGDFKTCAEDDPAALPEDCEPIFETNQPNVLLGLTAPQIDGGDTLWVRYGSLAFIDPTAGHADDPCLTPPAEQCWQEFDPSTAYLVAVDAAEGRVPVVAQFQLNDDAPQGELVASVVYDVTPPLSPSLVVARGPLALLDGFTDRTAVTITATALAAPDGTPDGEYAPLTRLLVARGATWDEAEDAIDVPYSSSSRSFTLADAPGTQTLRAWFCDRAKNCTPGCDVSGPTPDCTDTGGAATADIVYDPDEPTTADGATAEPTGTGITVASPGVWSSRSAVWNARIGLGDSGYDTAGGADIPEAVAYQLSLSAQFVGAQWTVIDFEALADGTTHVTVPGAGLPAVEGPHEVHARFKDAAGNVSDDAPFTLILDQTAPAGTITLAGGAEYWNAPAALPVTLSSTAARTQHVWDADLPSPDGATEIYTASHPADWSLGASSPAGSLDGRHVLRVRFFDAAGNYRDESASIVIDETPPTAATAIAQCYSCTTAGGVGYFSESGGNVTLFLFADDTGSGVGTVLPTVDSVVRPAVPFAPYVTLGVGAEGAHTVAIKFADRAGNATASPITLSIRRDETAPTVSSVTIAGGAFTATPSVSVAISATDSGVTTSIAGMYVTNSLTSFGGAALQPLSSPLEWTLDSSSDGEKTVRVKVVDYAGKTSDVGSDTIYLDRQGPALVFALADATSSSTTLTDSDQVTVNLTATECPQCSGVAGVYLSNDGVFSGSPLSYPLSGTWDMCPSGCSDGLRTVYVRVVDAVGNTSTAQASIVLDQTRPALSSAVLTAASGSTQYTNDDDVILSLGLVGADQVRLTGDLIDPLPNTWLTAATAIPVKLDGGTGLNTITVEARDAAGNLSTPVSTAAQIRFDDDEPTGVTLEINDDASHTDSRTVTLSISAGDVGSGIAGMALTNASTMACAGATYETFTSSKLWNLPLVAGTTYVTVCIKDGAGNTETATDDIILDLTTPGSLSVSIAGGAGYTTSAVDVPVTVSALDGISVDGALSYQISTDAAFSDVSSWSPFADGGAGQPDVATTTIDFTGTDGTQTVYLRVRDEAGWVSTASDTIVLDRDGPIAASVVVESDADITTGYADRAVALAAEDPTSGVADVALSSFTGAGSCSVGTWLGSFAPSTTFDLSNAAGTHTVCAYFKDEAGNVSGPFTDTIVVDLAAPSLSSVAVGATSGDCGVGDQHWTTSLMQLVRLTATDDTGVEQFQLSTSDTFEGAVWQTFTGSPMDVSTALDAFDGEQSVYARVRDAAGQSSNELSVCLTLDTEPPLPPVLTSAEGGYTTDTTTLVLADAFDQTLFDVTGSGSQGLIAKPVDGTVMFLDWVVGSSDLPDYLVGQEFTFPDDASFRANWNSAMPPSLDLTLKDPAGNVSSAGTLAMVYDNFFPLIDAFTVAGSAGVACGGAFSNTPQVEVSIEAHDVGVAGLTAYKLAVWHAGCYPSSSIDDVFDDDLLSPWLPTTGDVVETVGLPCGDGDYVFKLGVRDAAGKVTTTEIIDPNPPTDAVRCLTLDTSPPFIFHVASLEGDFTSDLTTQVKVVAQDPPYDHTSLKIVVSTDSNVELIRRAEDPPLDDFAPGEQIPWPADNLLEVNWLTGNGEKALIVTVIDQAGNESDPFTLSPSVTVDGADPSAPVIDLVDPGNAGAYLSWRAAEDAETGIQAYRVHYTTIDTPIDDGIVTVPGDQTSTMVLGAIDPVSQQPRGLLNKRQYEFTVYAIDYAGNETPSTVSQDVAIGWEVRPVVSSGTDVLVPQGVAYHNGKIYVLYHEQGFVFDPATGVGQVAAKAKLAISSDGGESWQLRAAGFNDGPIPGRIRSALSVGNRGIGVVTIDATMAGVMDLVELVSEDDGATWTKYPIDRNIGNWTKAPLALAMAGTGSSRVVLYNANENDTPTAADVDWMVVRRVRSPHDLHETDGVDTPTWWFDSGTTQSIVHRGPGAILSACNANFFDHAVWSGGLPPGIADTGPLARGEAWNMISRTHGRGPWFPNDTSTTPGEHLGAPEGFAVGGANPASAMTVACAPLGPIAWFYYFNLTLNNRITFLARTNEHHYADATGNLEPDSAVELAADAEETSPPAAWAGGPHVYLAYRRTTDGALVVKVGRNLPPPGPGEVTFEWQTNVVDESGDAGYNAVMNGYNAENVIIAYTDLQGTELKIARSALLAPQPAPDVRFNLARYRWSAPTTETAFATSVQIGATCDTDLNFDCFDADTTCAYTPATQYSFGPPNNRCVEVAALDDNGRLGDLGEKWQLAAFSEEDLGTEPWPSRVMSSRGNSVAVIGSTVAVLRPTYNKVRVEVSNDGGDTFPVAQAFDLYTSAHASCTTPGSPAPPDEGTPPSCIPYRGLAMTQDSGSNTTYLHVFYQTKGLSPERLEYRRGSRVGAGSWTWAAPVVLSPTTPDPAGPPPPPEVSGAELHVEASGATVAVIYRVGSTSIRARASVNNGATWSSPGPQGFGAMVAGDGQQPVIGHLSGNNIFAYYLRASGVPAGTGYDMRSLRSTDGGVSFTGTYTVCTDPGTGTGFQGVERCGAPRILAAGRNAQFGIVASVDIDRGQRLRISTTSDFVEAADVTQAALSWTRATLDAGDKTTLVSSLAMDTSIDGAWLAYSTCADFGLNKLWKLNLAYCERSCQSMENWKNMVVRNETSTTVSCDREWYNALAIDADESSDSLYISYVEDRDSGAAWTPKLKLLRGGWIQRKR